MKRLGLTRLALPDAVIFIDTPAAVSMARIKSRGEKMQVHETEKKLGHLREAYLLVVDAVRESMGLPAIVLDGSRDVDSIAAEARRVVNGVRATAGGNGE